MLEYLSTRRGFLIKPRLVEETGMNINQKTCIIVFSHSDIVHQSHSYQNPNVSFIVRAYIKPVASLYSGSRANRLRSAVLPDGCWRLVQILDILLRTERLLTSTSTISSIYPHSRITGS